MRIRQNREFFNIDPSVALDIMRDMADLLDVAGLYVYADGKSVVSKSKDEDKQTPSGAYQGPKYFSYNGKVLSELRKEMEQH